MSTAAAVAAGLILAATAPGAGVPRIAPPEPQPELTGDIKADFSSEYIWRGEEFNSEAVFLPSVRLNENGIELAALGVLDLTDSNDLKGDFSQWIFRGGLAKISQEVSFGLFYNYYYYPEHNRPKTQEVSLEMQWGYPAFFGLDVYWDFDYAEGLYGKASLGYTLDLDPVMIEPRIAAGAASGNYLNAYYGVDKDSFCDMDCSLAAEINVAGGFTLLGKISYYQLLTSDLRDAARAGREGDYWWYQGGAILIF